MATLVTGHKKWPLWALISQNCRLSSTFKILVIYIISYLLELHVYILIALAQHVATRCNIDELNNWAARYKTKLKYACSTFFSFLSFVCYDLHTKYICRTWNIIYNGESFMGARRNFYRGERQKKKFPPLPSHLKRGSRGITPGKFLKFCFAVGEF